MEVTTEQLHQMQEQTTAQATELVPKPTWFLGQATPVMTEPTAIPPAQSVETIGPPATTEQRPRSRPDQTHTRPRWNGRYCYLCGQAAIVPYEWCRHCKTERVWHHGRCCPARIQTRRTEVRILTSEFSGNLMEALDKWESIIREYDAMVEPEEAIQDIVKIATVVSRMGPGRVQDHLRRNMARWHTYQVMRQELAEIIEYDMRPEEICGLEMAWPKHPGANAGKRCNTQTGNTSRCSSRSSNAGYVRNSPPATSAGPSEELLAFDLVKETVAIGIDSGAAVTVWPSGWNKDYPLQKTQKTGTKYATAGAGAAAVVNEGERTLIMKTHDGTRRGAKVQVANVRKPLMSVADMVDAGQDIHFLASGQSYALHRETGQVTYFQRRRGVFELDVQVEGFRRRP